MKTVTCKIHYGFMGKFFCTLLSETGNWSGELLLLLYYYMHHYLDTNTLCRGSIFHFNSAIK